MQARVSLFSHWRWWKSSVDRFPHNVNEAYDQDNYQSHYKPDKTDINERRETKHETKRERWFRAGIWWRLSGRNSSYQVVQLYLWSSTRMINSYLWSSDSYSGSTHSDNSCMILLSGNKLLNPILYLYIFGLLKYLTKKSLNFCCLVDINSSKILITHRLPYGSFSKL